MLPSQDLFRSSQHMTVTAGWAIEFLMHQLLRKKRTIRLFPITQTVPGLKIFIYCEYPGRTRWSSSCPT